MKAVTVPSESRGVEVTVQRGGKRRASEEVQPHGLQPPRVRSQCGGKMSAHCCRMSSTTWFWNTMVMGMLASSISGRSSVGPNTMATFCTDIRFCSPCSITLQWERWDQELRGWGVFQQGPQPRPAPSRLALGSLACSPAQVLDEQSERVVVGSRQRAHQVTYTAAALGWVLQLWVREGTRGDSLLAVTKAGQPPHPSSP